MSLASAEGMPALTTMQRFCNATSNTLANYEEKKTPTLLEEVEHRDEALI